MKIIDGKPEYRGAVVRVYFTFGNWWTFCQEYSSSFITFIPILMSVEKFCLNRTLIMLLLDVLY